MPTLAELSSLSSPAVSMEQEKQALSTATLANAKRNPFLSTLAGTLQGTVGGGSLTALGNATGALGLKQASDALYRKGAELQADAAPYMAPQLDYTTVKDVGSAWDFAKANAAQGVGSMAPMIAGRVVGGPVLGLAAGLLPQQGENVSRIKNDPTLAGMSEAEILGAAAPTAALQTGLDYIVPGGVATNLARKAATVAGTGALGRAGATVGTNMLLEGGTELGQEELGMGMHGLLNPDRDTSGDEHARIQSFLGGAVGGAPTGAIDAGVGYVQDKFDAKPPKPLDISAESDGILKSRKPLHPNLTDTEMGEALTQRDAQESAQAEQLAQRVKAESQSPRAQKLADEFLSGDRSGLAAEAFVREVQRADKTEKWVDGARAAGVALREQLNKLSGGRLGSAYFDKDGQAHQTPSYLSQEFRDMAYDSPNAQPAEGMKFDEAGGVRYQKPAERSAQPPREYGQRQVTDNQLPPIPDEARERTIDNLMLAYRSSDLRKRAEAEAEAAFDIPDIAEPLNKWIELNFGADLNDGDVVVPKEMIKMIPNIDQFVTSLYNNKVRRGEPVPAPEMLQQVIAKINELETTPEYERQAGKKETYDEEGADNAELFDEIGTNALDPNVIGTRKVYYGKSDKKEVPFKPGDEAALKARAEGLAGSGMKTKPVGAWQRLKNAYPNDDVELYKKEDQLLATHAKEAHAALKSFKSQAATEEGQRKEYNTMRRLALETVDREVKFLEAEDAAPAERSDVQGEDFRTVTPKSHNNRWAVSTQGVKTGKFYGGPEHGAVWFKRASDGTEFATSVNKLIKLGRKADNLSGKKGVEEQKQALLAGISSFLNAKETNGEPALMGFGFKSDPKGPVELTDKLPANLKLHSGSFGDKVFTPQAQGAFDKYNRAGEKVDLAAEEVKAAKDKKSKWAAEQKLKRAKEELAVQERELRTGTIISIKATSLIERAERDGYAEEAKEVRDALDDLTESVGKRAEMDKARDTLQNKINELYDFLGRVGFDQDVERPVEVDDGSPSSLEQDFANPNKAIADRDESGEVARKAPEGSLAFGRMDEVQRAEYLKAGSVKQLRALLEKYKDEAGDEFTGRSALYQAITTELADRIAKDKSAKPTTREGKISWYATTLLEKGVDAMVATVRKMDTARYGEMYRMLKRVAGLDKEDPLWGSEAWKDKRDRKEASKLALEALNQLDKPSEKRLGNAMAPGKPKFDTSMAPAQFREKEAAKAEGADWVLAIEGVAGSYASKLAANAKKQGRLITSVDQVKAGDIIYMSVPGASREFVFKGSVYRLVPELLAKGAIIRGDNDANAHRSHNAPGEGVLYNIMQKRGYEVKENKNFAEWKDVEGGAKRPPQNIWYGSGENAALSNLAARPFELKGHKFLSVEHAYQSYKSGKFDEETFKKYRRAGQKIPGKAAKTEGGWNVKLMEKLVALSFEQNPEAMKILKATGDAVLTHIRPDKKDTSIWPKEFPRILMGVRDLQAAPKVVRLGFGETPPDGVISTHRKGYKNISNTTKGDYGKADSGWLGNPYIANDVRGGVLTREQAVDKYRKVFLAKIEADPDFKNAVEALRGQKLGYYKPSEHNHVSVITEYLGEGVTVVEHPVFGYRDRTLHNAKADVTMALAVDFTTAGERLTAKAAGKKLVQQPLGAKSSVIAEAVIAHMKKLEAKSLNVAGNGIYTLAEKGLTQEQVNDQVYKVLYRVHKAVGIEKIVTGGQTGVDIAGAIAARKLGIPVEVTMPKGFLQRNAAGKDLRHTQAEIMKQIEDGAKALKTIVPGKSDAEKKPNAQSSAEIPVGDETLTDDQKAEIHAAVFKRLGEMGLKLSKALFGTVGGKQVPLSADWGEGSIRIAANIGFKSAMQAAMHEGMHEFFHRLSQEPAGKAMLDKLLKAANSASVVRQLERLLTDHPNAMMQIKEGQPDYQNERLAYMYQFWQAGALTLGPETKTIFHRIMTYLRELTKLLSNDQQAELILQAFDDGKFSDKTKTSVVAKVMMADINARNAMVEKAVALAEGPIGRLKKVAVSAHSTLHDSGYDDLKDIANLFWLKPGERNADGSQGMFEARKQKASQYLNKMQTVLRKLAPKDLEAVRDALLREDGMAPKDMVQNQAYKDIRALLDEVHNYFDTAGVKRLVEAMSPGARKEWEKIPKRKNYFPVVWNVMGQEAEFVADLMKHHQREIMERLQMLGFDDYKETSKHLEYAQAIVVRLTNTQGDRDLGETSTSLGFSPMMSAVNERTLEWITAPEMTKYRSQDLVETMTSYIMQAVKRAEYVRQAGNGGATIKMKLSLAYTKMLEKRLWDAGATDADELAQKMMGTYREEYLQGGLLRVKKADKKYKVEDYGVTEEKVEEVRLDALKEISKYHNAIMALEGTLGHDISPTLRKMSGAMMVFQNFRLLIPTLFSSMSDPMGILVNGGEIDDAYDAMKRGFKGVWKTWTNDQSVDEATALAETMGWVDAGSFMETMGQTYSSLYMAGGVKRLNDGLFKWNGMEAWNRGMRVGASIAAQKFIIKHMTTPDKNSERYLKELFGDSRPELFDGKLNLQDEKVQQAVMRWVDGAILAPNAAQRPVWASDPHWALLFHMKQFTYSFHKVILKKAWDEGVVRGNAGPMLTLIAGYMPIVIAADALRAIVMSGGEEPYWMQKGVGSTLWHGMERANFAGVPQLGLDAFAKTANSKEGIIDATLEGAASLAGPTTGWAKDWYDKPVGEQTLRSLPLGSTWAKFAEDDGEAV